MKEKRRRRKLRNKIIKITAAVAVQLICLFAYLLTSSHYAKGLIYKNSTYEENIVIEADEKIESDFNVLNNEILYSTKNGVNMYNLQGEYIRSAHSGNLSSIISAFLEPQIKLYEKSACAFDKNGRKFIIFDNEKILVEGETEYIIQTVKMFENKSFAVIAGDAGAKNQMILYNPKGEKEFVWHSGVDNITDVTVSEDGNKIAVLTAELTESGLNSKLLFFNKGEVNAFETKKYDNILITNINFIKTKTILAVSDSGLFYFGSDGKEKKFYSFNDKFLSAYKISDEGLIVLNFASVSDSSCQVEIVGPDGRLKGTRYSKESINAIDVNNTNILLTYDNTADIISENGKKIRTVNNGRELKKALFLGRNKLLLVGKSDIKVIR